MSAHLACRRGRLGAGAHCRRSGGIGGAPTRGPYVLPAMRDDLPQDRLRSSQGRSGSPRVPQSPAEGQSQSGGEGSPESWRGLDMPIRNSKWSLTMTQDRKVSLAVN